MIILLGKLAQKLNVKGEFHFTAKIGEDQVSISTFSAEMPETALGVNVGEVEDHTFQAVDKDGVAKDITIKRAKFLGWAHGDRLSKEQEMRLAGEIKASVAERTVAKAGETKYTGALSF